MKAITLWQPWGSSMAVGIKTNETRSWPTKHVGELAICSAARKIKATDLPVDVVKLIWSYAGLFPGFNSNVHELFENLPLGRVLCVVNVLDCLSTDAMVNSQQHRPGPTEMMLGDYSPGRFAWRTTDRRTMSEPVPVVGRQGIFNLPPSVEALVRERMMFP